MTTVVAAACGDKNLACNLDQIEELLFDQYLGSTQRDIMSCGWHLLLDPAPIAYASMVLPARLEERTETQQKLGIQHRERRVERRELDDWVSLVKRKFAVGGKAAVFQLGPPSAVFPEISMLQAALWRHGGEWADSTYPPRHVVATHTTKVFDLLSEVPRIPFDNHHRVPAWQIEAADVPSPNWIKLFGEAHGLPSASDEIGDGETAEGWAFLLGTEDIKYKLFVSAVAPPLWNSEEEDPQLQVVGLLHATMEPKRGLSAIHTLFVPEAWRHRGVALTMLATFHKWALELWPDGCKMIFPVPQPSSSACEALLIKLQCQSLYEQRWVQLPRWRL